MTVFSESYTSEADLGLEEQAETFINFNPEIGSFDSSDTAVGRPKINENLECFSWAQKLTPKSDRHA